MIYYLFLVLFLIYLYLIGKLDVKSFPFLLVKSLWFKDFIYKFYYNNKKLVLFFDKAIKFSLIIIIPIVINYFFQLIIKIFEFFQTKEPIASLVLPGVKTKTFYLPFLEGVISIFIMAFLHELFHGILALKNKIPLKSAGFGFFLIIPIAFIEIDETLLRKIKIIDAISILIAGSFINLLTGFSGFLILKSMNDNYFLNLFNSYKKVMIVGKIKNTYAYYSNLSVGEIIEKINGIKINGIEDLYKAIDKNKNYVILETNKGKYNLTFTKINNTKLIGIYVKEKIFNKNIFVDFYYFIKRLLFYFSFLSVNVGIVNLFPLFITDGQKILDLILEKNKNLFLLNRILSLFFLIVLLISAILGI